MSVADVLRQLSGRHQIDGRQVRGAGESPLPVVDPATEELIGELLEATPAEVDAAVKAANAAQKRWNKVNYHRRAELLHEAAHAMREKRAVIAEMLTREMGKPYKESADEVV